MRVKNFKKFQKNIHTKNGVLNLKLLIWHTTSNNYEKKIRTVNIQIYNVSFDKEKIFFHTILDKFYYNYFYRR